jgi:tetratricopeptide (TPR) repeat protein
LKSTIAALRRKIQRERLIEQNRTVQAEILAKALDHHRAGRLSQAEALYREILAADPRHADSLHLLGMVEHQRGRHETSLSMIGAAIAINPGVAAFHSNLGTVFQAQGNLTEAAACFERALALRPDWAEVHSNLGNILQSQGKLEEAAASQERALDLKPNFAEACSNLGNVRHAQGRLADAVACYERALALKPDYVDAHNNLGTALLDQNRIDEAIAHCERALGLNPNHAAAHNNLGNALMRQDRIEDARLHYERALELKPDYANAHNNLGNVLKEQGLFDDAMAHYGKAIAIKPEYAEAYLNRTELKRFQPGDTEFAELEKLAANDDLPADKALFIHFALAKALDDVGDYEGAFEQMLQGNVMKRRQIDYQEDRALELVQRILTVFDRSLFDRFEGAGHLSPIPVFVVGMPRSGSTLIEQILAGHPQIHAAGELTILEKMEARDFPQSVPGLDSASLRLLGETYLSRLPKAAESKFRIVDKLPGNFLRIGLIRLILPNARIIHTTRHPLDTCLSCYSKLFTDGLLFSYDLAELGRYYRSYRELMDHWRRILPQDAILDVSYENVVDDLETEARRMIAYCGLPWDDRCINFHRNARTVRTASSVQVRQPLFRTSMERWRHYESHLGPLIAELPA